MGAIRHGMICVPGAAEMPLVRSREREETALRRVGIVGCSNPLAESRREALEGLLRTLRRIGLEPVTGGNLFAPGGLPAARAEALMALYRDPSIDAIFDVTGGDLANEVLGHLDWPVIAASEKPLWGYSDLTCLLNAILARTGRPSVLYTAWNLVGGDAARQQRDFCHSLNGGDALFRFDVEFLQGTRMAGDVAGGNIRCLLKLAGTPFWPDLRRRILLLESLGASAEQFRAYIAQLDQIGAFDAAAGVLLGTFTWLEAQGGMEDAVARLSAVLGPEKPLARTRQIGHGADSRAVWIGRRIELSAL